MFKYRCLAATPFVSIAIVLGSIAAEPSMALAASNIECVNFVSDYGFTLQQADGWTVYFEDNLAPSGADTGLYTPQRHGAYALNPKGERVIDGTITYLDTLDEADLEFRFDWVGQSHHAQYRTYSLRMARVGPDGDEVKTWAPSGPNHYRMTDMHSNDPIVGDLAWWPVNNHRFRCGAERFTNQATSNGVFKVFDASSDWLTD